MISISLLPSNFSSISLLPSNLFSFSLLPDYPLGSLKSVSGDFSSGHSKTRDVITSKASHFQMAHSVYIQNFMTTHLPDVNKEETEQHSLYNRYRKG